MCIRDRNYIQHWGASQNDLKPDEVLHFKWLSENAGAWGVGLGQPLAYRGVGYKTASGKTIKRPSMFAINEMMTDIEAKMVYAGLPRYDVYAKVKDDALRDVTSAYEKTDPLQNMIHNFEGEVKTVSLDTQNRFDSFLRSLDDTFLNGIMTPIPRMFSSLNFTYASADAAIEAYLPFIRMYQRAHKRFIENHVYKPVLLEDYEPEMVKKSEIHLNWGQQGEVEYEEIRQVYDILKDPMFKGRFNPDDILEMLKEKMPQLEIIEEAEREIEKGMEQIDDRVRELGEIAEGEKGEKEVPLDKLPPEDQYNILRSRVIKRMLR